MAVRMEQGTEGSTTLITYQGSTLTLLAHIHTNTPTYKHTHAYTHLNDSERGAMGVRMEQGTEEATQPTIETITLLDSKHIYIYVCVCVCAHTYTQTQTHTHLNDSERGAMGVRMEQGTEGATIGPLALME